MMACVRRIYILMIKVFFSFFAVVAEFYKEIKNMLLLGYRLKHFWKFGRP